MAASIGLARAFTKKVNQKLFDKDENSFTARLMNKRNNEPASIDRNMISLPVELIMASNPLAFDAPDLKDAQLIHSNAQQTPSQQSVVSSTPTSKRSFETDGTSTPSLSHSGSWTPGSSRLQSPTESSEPMTYFLGGQQHSLKPQPSMDAVLESDATSDAESDMIKMHNSYATPAIPKRAPSHTRATHRELARQRSVSRLRESADASPRESVRTSAAPPSTTTGVEFSNPFGAELEQVKELVDEYSNGNTELSFDRRRDSETLSSAMNTRSDFVVAPMRSKSRLNSNKKEAVSEPIIVDEETQQIIDKGFNIHCANDYLDVIQDLYDEFCSGRF